MTKSHIAFFGLGLMGSGMAQRLLAGGYRLTVFNRSVRKTDALAAQGAQVATSPREAASHADVVVSMVADDEASNRIWLGEEGALSGIRPGTVCIECSTVTVDWARKLGAAVAAGGGEFLDAPVTGSKAQAAAGELNFLVGGAADTLEKARPVLAAMSKSIVSLGPVGSGAFFKLINNFVCGVQVAALAEAIGLIERGGLDPAKAVDLLKGGAAGSPLVHTVAARMMASDFTPNFLLKLMAKDLRYAIQESRKLSVDLATAEAALADFQDSIAARDGDKDIAALVEQFRRKG